MLSDKQCREIQIHASLCGKTPQKVFISNRESLVILPEVRLLVPVCGFQLHVGHKADLRWFLKQVKPSRPGSNLFKATPHCPPPTSCSVSWTRSEGSRPGLCHQDSSREVLLTDFRPPAALLLSRPPPSSSSAPFLCAQRGAVNPIVMLNGFWEESRAERGEFGASRVGNGLTSVDPAAFQRLSAGANFSAPAGELRRTFCEWLASVRRGFERAAGMHLVAFSLRSSRSLQ